MKSEEEIKQRMKDSMEIHQSMMKDRTYDELDEAGQEYVTRLWHEVNVLQWILKEVQASELDNTTV
jgi:hypothetical protein